MELGQNWDYRILRQLICAYCVIEPRIIFILYVARQTYWNSDGYDCTSRGEQYGVCRYGISRNNIWVILKLLDKHNHIPKKQKVKFKTKKYGNRGTIRDDLATASISNKNCELYKMFKCADNSTYKHTTLVNMAIILAVIAVIIKTRNRSPM